MFLAVGRERRLPDWRLFRRPGDAIYERPRSQSLLSDKFKMGADATVAAGPVGRNTAAGTNSKFNAEILSYSGSKKGLLPGSARMAPSCRPTRAETRPCTVQASPAGRS